jgi:hypothetical protein
MSGRPSLQNPGPTTMPNRILGVVTWLRIDHRGPGFAALTHSIALTRRNVFGSGR